MRQIAVDVADQRVARHHQGGPVLVEERTAQRLDAGVAVLLVQQRHGFQLVGGHVHLDRIKHEIVSPVLSPANRSDQRNDAD